MEHGSRSDRRQLEDLAERCDDISSEAMSYDCTLLGQDQAVPGPPRRYLPTQDLDCPVADEQTKLYFCISS